jgi:hypothetical protein
MLGGLEGLVAGQGTIAPIRHYLVDGAQPKAILIRVELYPVAEPCPLGSYIADPRVMGRLANRSGRFEAAVEDADRGQPVGVDPAARRNIGLARWDFQVVDKPGEFSAGEVLVRFETSKRTGAGQSPFTGAWAEAGAVAAAAELADR